MSDNPMILSDNPILLSDNPMILSDNSMILSDNSMILSDNSMILSDILMILSDISIILSDNLCQDISFVIHPILYSPSIKLDFMQLFMLVLASFQKKHYLCTDFEYY